MKNINTYEYTIAWMKLYDILMKRLENTIMKEYKNKLNDKEKK